MRKNHLALLLVVFSVFYLSGCSLNRAPEPIQKLSYFNNSHSIREGLYSEIKLDSIEVKTQETNIVVTQGNQQLITKSPENFRGFSEAELSIDGNMLAFTALQSEGSKVYVVDFKENKIISLVENEVVAHPSWSPKENKLVFVTGKVANQYLAFWTTKSNDVIRENKFISILGLKWDISGKYFDFIAEQPSDNFSLNQVDVDNKTVMKIRNITRDEVKNWINPIKDEQNNQKDLTSPPQTSEVDKTSDQYFFEHHPYKGQQIEPGGKKKIAITSEETKSTFSFVKITPKGLPFTLSIPEQNWAAYALPDGLLLQYKENDLIGQIEIHFFAKGTTEKEAVSKAMEFVNNYSQHEEKEKTEGSILNYSMSSPYEGSKQYVFGDILLGKHDSQYFYIYGHMDSPDGYERFYPIEKAILSEWVWEN